MARYAIIENGIVANIAESDDALADNWSAIRGKTRVDKGYSFDGRAYTAPAPVVEVPTSVTPAQGKLALLDAGLLDEAEAVINALTGDTKTAALIYWNSALAFERSHALVASIGAALGLDSGEIDNLFITAAAL